MELFWEIVAGLALIAVLVLALVLRNTRRRHAARTAAQEALQQRQAQSHDDQLRGLSRQHSDALADQRSRTAAYEAVTLRAMGWDVASRDMIIDVCEELGVAGVLMTNIVFVPIDTKPFYRYAAQVDHVLVVGASVLLVESKRWNGVVFDGINPAAAHPSFGRLLAPPPGGPFAVQIVPDTPEHWIVRTYPSRSSLAPAAQARRQAARFHHYLAAVHGPSAPRVDTCVFYSHPNAQVFARPKDTAGDFSTLIADGYDGLRRVLRGYVSNPSSRRAMPSAVLETLVDVATDVVELGTAPMAVESDLGAVDPVDGFDDDAPGLTIREVRGVPDWFTDPRHHD
ncbi:nuclease-related domain-containing protein [Curtobacterium sp. VKM Ac-2887]|uniref:nuclease-related domain-containing protein n=1 Tax=Curtobacterium sp. VKM Ac-2887 TaxID=2783819 RepID=UPI00188D5DE4|nr:nuclease-related domain-containing protein [Curtobacterium sp. VKM Ac-2887]MBF4587966.1 NERD domain-containing protein [Curtobacterium sp. VKM Ac-2887]